MRPRGSGIRFRRGIAAAALVAVAACDSVGVAPETPPPILAAPASPAPDAAPPSAASAAARAYYANVQAQLLAQGLMRTDGGGRDTPYTDRMLAENFIRIALYDEYARGPGGPVQRVTKSSLRRWVEPVRIGLRFGASVPADKRATDTARVVSYVARLSRATGHPIRLDDTNPNFIIQVVNEDERRALGPAIAAALPGLSAAETSGITNLPRSTYCLVYSYASGERSTYSRALVVIRAEHPDLLRLSCYHEEIAQGLGLANDSPNARPSIFNDDEEFALLTRHDEYLLRMLYSPSLRPGMTEDEARPIVESLASRLIGGES